MPRDFDAEKQNDLSFKIGGEEFQMRYVRPEVLAAWEDEPAEQKSTEAIKKLDERIKLFLQNGDGERWDALRSREEDPISMGQLNSLLIWMIEVQSNLPTTQPSPSASGRGRTATTSKAG